MPVRSNIVLVGLPAAGKSTLGVLLAKRLSLDFVDTDVVIQVRQGRRLQEIIDGDGAATFRDLEEKAVLSLSPERTVIATGGSVVYGERAMQHLRSLGRIVYLHLEQPLWEKRLSDLDTRGVVRAPGQSLASLYAQREPLYRRWAERIVEVGDLGHTDAVERIAAAVRD